MFYMETMIFYHLLLVLFFSYICKSGSSSKCHMISLYFSKTMCLDYCNIYKSLSHGYIEYKSCRTYRYTQYKNVLNKAFSINYTVLKIHMKE